MTALFSSTADLRQYVRISATLPWDSISCYVDSALDMYLRRYLSDEVMTALDSDSTFLTLSRKALAPLAVYLAADEMAVMIGDAGITVQNEKDKRAVASDRKIQKARESLQERGLMALSVLLEYVASRDGLDLSTCPRLESMKGMLLSTLAAFEEYVSLQGSFVAFLEIVPTMKGIERRLEREIGPELMARIRTQSDSETILALHECCRSYVAYATASLLSSERTRRQRMAGERIEWHGLVRPLFEDSEERQGWYQKMEGESMAAIRGIIESHSTELGIEHSDSRVDYHGKGKRIFYI